MATYVYEQGTIDFWDGWMKEDEMRKSISPAFDDEEKPDRLAGALETAYRLAKSAGWEGDIREGPFFAGLPPPEGDYTPYIMIAFKQDNNGTTYVISPFRLDWLGKPKIVARDGGEKAPAGYRGYRT